MNDKIRRTHLERRAVVYLRQSSMRQVHENQESTARQYGLRQRAIELGWTADGVQVVDEDLGQSGTSTQGREGFQKLAEDVAHGRVGAIFALEVSRLARCSADWHRLLDLCGLADVLIADESAVYAPRDPNDRLLLGLKGQMSEAELYWMRLRLQGGRLSKARRGALFVLPATGYQWDPGAERLRRDPDEHVQTAIALVFERFRLDGSARAVARYFATKGLKLPRRDAVADEIRWANPGYSPIYKILRSPVYAGAYVYGRTEERRALVDGEVQRRHLKRLPQEAWTVCLPDHHPGYIGWEEFMANQEKLHANRTNHASPEQRGAARQGAALLQGVVLCGRCGHRMTVSYHRQPQYFCDAPGRHTGRGGNCWSVPARAIDVLVTRLFLQVAQPPEIELSLAVAREAEHQATEVERQWRLRLERVRYEAKLTERRYKAVDPDNRVVVRTLERDWEEKLQEVERTEREYHEVRRREKVDLSDDDRARILTLARDLPHLWHASTTTQAQRKNLLRMLVREVTLSPIDVPTRMTRVEVLWETGAVTEEMVDRPSSKTQSATPLAAVERIREMITTGVATEAIVDDLNRRGLTTGKGRPWDPEAIWRVRRRYALKGPPPPPRTPRPRADGLLSTPDAAVYFGITASMVRDWIGKGWVVPAAGGGRGVAWAFRLDEETVERFEVAKTRGSGPRNRLGHSHGQDT